MIASPHARRLVGLAFCLALFLLAPGANGQGKSDGVRFDTVDGVRLEGTYYPSNKGAKAPCVLLLHDFDRKNGGTSRTDGWDSLATELQKKGFAVLSFDFRGFGQSTTVSPVFWTAPHNRMLPGARMVKPAMTINYKQFPSSYYRFLTSDVAAAKAFLDGENDATQCNSRNLIVIGAGQGATVGLMWMAAEYKRHKVIVGQGLIGPMPIKMTDETAGDDMVCGVWLNLSRTLDGQPVPINNWIQEVGKTRKLPLVFLFGDKDEAASKESTHFVKLINPAYVLGKPVVDKELQCTGAQGIKNTKLAGSKLLDKELDTEDFIIKAYLDPVMEKHRFTQWQQRDTKNTVYYWRNALGSPILAKQKGDSVPIPLPLQVLGK
jgi:hypothetical protein